MNGVTVVTAAYRPENMDSVWESIKSQTYRPIEWIVVNDGQQGIRDWFDANIGRWDEEKRRSSLRPWLVDLGRRKGRFGLFGRNVGALVASFDHIIFHDDDVLWHDNEYVSKMVAVAQAGKIPVSDLSMRGSTNESWVKFKRVEFAPEGIDLGNLMYTKQMFQKYGYFVDDDRHKVMFDWELIKKIHEGEGADSFVKIDSAITFFHKKH